MSKHMFTSEQIKALLRNENVKNCTSKAVTFTKAFKIKAVKDYYENGLSPNMIFQNAGIDLNLIGRKQPKWCIWRWKKVYKDKGIQGLNENRGKTGKRKSKASEPDDLEYLKTKIKYLEAENSFLKKLKTNKTSNQSKNTKSFKA